MNHKFQLLSAILFVALISACNKTPKSETSLEPVNYLSPDSMNMGWNTSYDSITHKIDFTDAWGGIGWIFGDDNGNGTSADFSDYTYVTAEIANVEGKAQKVHVCVCYTNSTVESWNAISATKGESTLRVELDDSLKSHVHRIFIQCDSTGSFILRDSHLENDINYAEPVELQVSSVGVISSDQFEGFSDDARVDFTFVTEGEMLGINEKGELADMHCWCLGVICSVADVLSERLQKHYIFLSKIGEQSYSCYLHDIRDLLEAVDDDGESGIFWTVWPIGNLTKAEVVRTTISEKLNAE